MSNEQIGQEVTIDFAHKQKLEEFLTGRILVENNNNERWVVEWIGKNGAEISEIINENSVVGAKIRELAFANEYGQAADTLWKELKNRGLLLAA